MASSATSNRLNTTCNSRGTPGYRAPEILVEDPKYNNKVDIFALGCIIYELVAREKLFHNDLATKGYGQSGIISAIRWPETDGDSKTKLLFLERQMIEIDPSKRPSSRDLSSIRGDFIEAYTEIER